MVLKQKVKIVWVLLIGQGKSLDTNTFKSTNQTEQVFYPEGLPLPAPRSAFTGHRWARQGGHF